MSHLARWCLQSVPAHLWQDFFGILGSIAAVAAAAILVAGAAAASGAEAALCLAATDGGMAATISERATYGSGGGVGVGPMTVLGQS
jgi:hypothetical protein